LGTAVGAHGVEADSDKATFPKVTIETAIGHDKGIKLKVPYIIPGMGSTNIAKQNWEGLAKGAALSGSILTVGENVCGMDDESEIKNGKIVRSPDMESRIKFFRDFQEDGYGTVAVQANVEDTRLGVQEYVINKLGIETVELKWGQGAKDIGGEVKIKSLKKAQELKKKGYIVLPDPEDPSVIKSFEKGSFKEFERHSRLGMVEEESLLTVDGAGGGTGMSPWRMMNEWGIPSVEIWSLLYQYLRKLDEKGEYIPDVCAAGGITFEDQIYKVLALGAPYFKAVGMARGPMAATMVGKTIGKRISEDQIPVYVERFGNTAEEIFVTAPELKKKFKDRFNDIPTGAIGLYTYFHRLSQGLRQLMAGNRKFALKYITRDDIAALTQDAANISGIPYITEVDKEEVDKILEG
jgi:glutamate synthase domain-containing protein 2